jgi:hypothetical protein
LRRAFRPNTPYRVCSIHEYSELAELEMTAPDPPYIRFPGITPGWDNTARRKRNALVLVNSTPDLYEHWLRGITARMTPPSPEENFVFVNAWNEWAEGNHLEPSQRWGRAYLEAHARAVGTQRDTGHGTLARTTRQH